MKRELGIARCGLACCLCSENVKCGGCNSGGCPGFTDCKNRLCSIDKQIKHCFECEEDCRKGLFQKIKPYVFTLFVKRYGEEELLNCLERNEQNGVVYHREGMNGDYDEFTDVEELIAFIKAGKSPEKKATLNYEPIRNYFKDWNKSFPLKDEECVGLTDEEKAEINACGTYCGKCEDYGVICDGCRNRNGHPIWYELYNRPETCSYHVCCGEKRIHDCSECKKVPCKDYFIYPDPNMPEETQQWWFRLRMNNFNKLKQDLNIEVNEDYQKNVEKYGR